MKKLFTMLMLAVMSFGAFSTAFAIQHQPKTKSGKLDKRYNANKHVTKSGKPDMRYNTSKKATKKKK